MNHLVRHGGKQSKFAFGIARAMGITLEELMSPNPLPDEILRKKTYRAEKRFISDIYNELTPERRARLDLYALDHLQAQQIEVGQRHENPTTANPFAEKANSKK